MTEIAFGHLARLCDESRLTIQSKPNMPATPPDLFALLDRLHIAHATIRHAPAFTVADAQALRGQIRGGHTKNLFLKDKKGALFLLVAMEDAVIRLNELHGRIGAARLSFASPALLMEKLGVPPGSVTPFAAINDTARAVSILLDAAMMARDILNFHPLDNTMTTTISSADLMRFFEATGHHPRLIDLVHPNGQTGD